MKQVGNPLMGIPSSTSHTEYVQAIQQQTQNMGCYLLTVAQTGTNFKGAPLSVSHHLPHIQSTSNTITNIERRVLPAHSGPNWYKLHKSCATI